MKGFAIAASLAAAALGAGTAQAATTVTVSGTRGVVIASNGPVAQTFVATDSLLTNFGFQFSSSTAVTTGSVTFSLLAGVATSGTAIATQTVSLAGLAMRTGAFYDVFTGSAALVVGQTYTALLSAASANVSLNFGPNSNGTVDAYLPGRLIKNNALDQACANNNYCDANFRFTAAAAAVVPEPATWGMMLLGFAMVGGAIRYRRRGVALRFS